VSAGLGLNARPDVQAQIGAGPKQAGHLERIGLGHDDALPESDAARSESALVESTRTSARGTGVWAPRANGGLAGERRNSDEEPENAHQSSGAGYRATRGELGLNCGAGHLEFTDCTECYNPVLDLKLSI
jgi:hypothetical protein